MSADIHVGDVGTVFLVTIKDQDGVAVDVSTASTLNLIFKKPGGGALITKTAVFNTTGTDGRIKYISVTGFIDTAGEWECEGYVVIGSNSWHSDRYAFRVEPILAA